MTHQVYTDRGVRWIRLIHPNPEPEYDQTDIELLSEDNLNTAYDVVAFDLGHPSVRDVTRAVPHIDGERDTTRFHGSRIMTIDVKIFEYEGRGPNYWRSKLRQFMHPGSRFYVEFMLDGANEPLRAYVRCDTATYEFMAERPSHLEDTIILTVPSGRFESATEKSLIIRPGVPEGGRSYPLVYPRVYPNIGPIGGVHVHNFGNARANAKFRIYGPITGPMLMNHSMPMAGTMHGFMAYVFKDDFEIQAGSYIEINPDMRTITMNGMPNDSMLHMLDYENSVWWSIEPTHNDLMLSSMMFDRPAQAHILWRDTYL